MRKLASIQRIKDLQPIEGADRIEKATVNGWNVVVGKGIHQVGDLVCYFEIDSWVPHEVAPELSRGNEPRTFEGVKGERLRTMKLRGVLSQGYIIPIKELPLASKMDLSEGDDVTDILGVLKWERPIPAQLQGQAKGSFPSFISKTDQERVQNLVKDPSYFSGEWEMTLKMDGSSMTMYVNGDDVGVCSRNLELKDNDANENNSFIRMARSLNYESVLKKAQEYLGMNFAVQGELCGEGVNGNWDKFDGLKFFVFDIYDIDNQHYVLPHTRQYILSVINSVSDVEWKHVPVLTNSVVFDDTNVEYFLRLADRPSVNNKVAEGVVFKNTTDYTKSFKAINDKFLLKKGE
jgi:RNA ligase (TIGR02306 family)